MCTIPQTPFRKMRAEKTSPCPYCAICFTEDTIILGAYGIRWGHEECIKRAFEDGMLILSSVNADKRHPELAARAHGKAPKRKKQAPAWSDEAMGKPETVCLHFPPKLIQVVSLPEDLKLNPNVVNEMDAEAQAAAEAGIWEAFLRKWMSEYKRTSKIPYCPVHQWSHDPKDHLQLKVVPPNGNKFETQRALWWYCPGK